MATTWLVRTTGNDNNGGTSATVRSTGTDGVTNGTNTLTAASASWTSADIGQGIYIGGVWRLVVTVPSSTSLTFSGATIASGTGKTWTIGGAFATIGKGTTSESLAAGDTVYVGAGTYRISAALMPTSMASMTYLYGDTDGTKTGDAGEIVLSNYATNDTTAPSAVFVIDFGTLPTNYWTVGRMSLIQGNSSYSAIIGWNSNNHITLQDLSIWAAQRPIQIDGQTFGSPLNWTIERCRMVSAGDSCFSCTLPTSATGSDVDLAVTFRNCQFLVGARGAVFYSSGSAAKRSGGIRFYNCFFSATGQNAVEVGDVYGSTVYPVSVYNSLVIGYNGLVCAAAGQIVENYNVIVAPVPRTNVTAGANSISNGSHNWRYSFGHEASFGGVTRPFGEFPAASPLLKWGGTSVPSDDINGVTRPASGEGQSSTQQALGPFERSNSGTKDTSTYKTGSPSLKITGPGYEDFELPVLNGHATTVSVYGYYNGSYTGTLPQMLVLNGGECGVANATATQTGSASTWTQMSLTFTPTADGIVTIRLQSNSTAAAGTVNFDDFSYA